MPAVFLPESWLSIDDKHISSLSVMVRRTPLTAMIFTDGMPSVLFFSSTVLQSSGPCLIDASRFNPLAFCSWFVSTTNITFTISAPQSPCHYLTNLGHINESHSISCTFPFFYDAASHVLPHPIRVTPDRTKSCHGPGRMVQGTALIS